MRAFSNIARAVDSSGIPVNGKIYFYVNGTQTLAGIKNSSGTNIVNPQPMVNGKPQVQVFLPDQDIHYVITKLDGTTQIEDGVDKYLTFNVASEGVDVATFKTVAAMRLSVGCSDGDVCQLLGYNAAGDKPVTSYTYTRGVTQNDDGGSIISCVDGYWTLCEPDVIDARHWGCFAYGTTAQAYEHANASQFTRANAYAVARKKILFLGDGYYYIGSGEYTTENGIVFSATGSTITVNTESTKVYGDNSYNATFTVKGEEIHQSQLLSGSEAISCKRYIVDQNKYRNCSNCDVYIMNNLTWSPSVGYITWYNVNVYSDHRINATGLRIQASFINPIIFDNNFSTAHLIACCSGCRTDSNLWSDSNKWTLFCAANRSNVIEDNAMFTGNIDVQGVITATGNISSSGNVSGATITSTGTATLANAAITNGLNIGGVTTAHAVMATSVTGYGNSSVTMDTARFGTMTATSKATCTSLCMQEIHSTEGTQNTPDQYLMNRTSEIGDIVIAFNGDSGNTNWIQLREGVSESIAYGAFKMFVYAGTAGWRHLT